MYGLRRIDRRIPYVLVAVVVTTLISWATGYEKNIKVPLEAIASQDARKLIVDFNAAVNGINQLAADRAALAPQISEAEQQSGPHSARVLDLQYQALVLGTRMEELKEQSHTCRTALREFLFDGVVDPDGKRLFYLEGELPQDRQE